MSAETMAGTHIDCCVSNCAQADIIPNVNKSADAQLACHMMTHVTKTNVGQSMMDGTSDREYAVRALATPEFGPRKLYANLSRNGMNDGSFLALIWTPTD